MNNLFKSIRLYIEDYRDTSKKKSERINALAKGEILVRHILEEMIPNSPGSTILAAPFAEMQGKMEDAVFNSQELYDFSDDIGFLRILDREL
jgi:hypothetical protein